MDKTLEKLVTYTLSAPTLNPTARRKANEVLFDSIGCIVLGSDCEPAAIAARRARKTTWGAERDRLRLRLQDLCGACSVANTMMVRYYDYNDSYPPATRAT